MKKTLEDAVTVADRIKRTMQKTDATFNDVVTLLDLIDELNEKYKK